MILSRVAAVTGGGVVVSGGLGVSVTVRGSHTCLSPVAYALATQMGGGPLSCGLQVVSQETLGSFIAGLAYDVAKA